MPCARDLPLSLTLSQSVSAGIVVPAGAAPICAAIDGSKIHSRYQNSTRNTRPARAQRHGKSSEKGRLDTEHNMRQHNVRKGRGHTARCAHHHRHHLIHLCHGLRGHHGIHITTPAHTPATTAPAVPGRPVSNAGTASRGSTIEGQSSTATRATLGRARLAQSAMLSHTKSYLS